jgi:hypothetical protein
MATPPVVEAPNRKPYIVAGVLGGAVVILVVALILSLNNRAPVTQNPSALPPRPGAPLTQAPSASVPQPGAPVTQAPGANPPKVGAEDPDKAAVAAYLQKISYIERQRQLVVNDLSEALLVAQLLQSGLSNPLQGPMADLLEPDAESAAKAKQKATTETGDQAQQTVNSYVDKLRQLDAQLRATLPVPKPAFEFARAYDNAFAAYAGAMIKIGQVMDQAHRDPNQASALATQLSQLKGPLQVQAQQGLATADQQLVSLCNRYGIPKPFDVTDTPVGGVTGR